MSDIQFGFMIFASLFATMTSYAVLMTILKREPSLKWTSVLSLATLLFSALSSLLSISYLTGTAHGMYKLSTVFLLIAFIFTLILVIMQKVEKSDAPEKFISLSKTMGMLIFASLLVHLFTLIAGLAWF